LGKRTLWEQLETFECQNLPFKFIIAILNSGNFEKLREINLINIKSNEESTISAMIPSVRKMSFKFELNNIQLDESDFLKFFKAFPHIVELEFNIKYAKFNTFPDISLLKNLRFLSMLCSELKDHDQFIEKIKKNLQLNLLFLNEYEIHCQSSLAYGIRKTYWCWRHSRRLPKTT